MSADKRASDCCQYLYCKIPEIKQLMLRKIRLLVVDVQNDITRSYCYSYLQRQVMATFRETALKWNRLEVDGVWETCISEACALI
jgi:uncharacterized protein YbbC (DUF1343 family)